MAGALLAIDLGFMGPNYSISTACATANYCIYAAAKHIQNGDADIMLCGGAESPINPIGLAGFVACKALSEQNDSPQTASHPYKTGRFVMGECRCSSSRKSGACTGARRPIYAEYLGERSPAITAMTSPREDGQGVAMCIEGAIRDAHSREEINYINAHATQRCWRPLRKSMLLKGLWSSPQRDQNNKPSR
jgi:3-oxoacyl-[acyl-carrier-protein] synthase II